MHESDQLPREETGASHLKSFNQWQLTLKLFRICYGELQNCSFSVLFIKSKSRVVIKWLRRFARFSTPKYFPYETQWFDRETTITFHLECAFTTMTNHDRFYDSNLDRFRNIWLPPFYQHNGKWLQEFKIISSLRLLQLKFRKKFGELRSQDS